MRQKLLEVAEVFRLVASETPLLILSSEKAKVFSAITRCRTKELGGHLNCCDKCGYEEQSYNSCLNRHCPKCRGGKVFDWVSAREEELLPVPYFHVVFTLPEELRGLCFQNKRLIYELFFKSSAEALQAVAERFLGAKLGFFGVLHTWNQELQYHPHIHYVIPAGGLSPDNTKWVSTESSRFFLPVRALSKVFRGKFIEALKDNFPKLRFFNSLSHLGDVREFNKLLWKSVKHDWVVYAKKPFAGPAGVLRYLASYTHRVAISNRRLRSLSSDKVTFITRDRKNKRKKKLKTLHPQEFMRRFFLHIIPKGFKRIRYFGFLYNQRRKENLMLCRKLIGAPLPQTNTDKPHPRQCPKCSLGRLITTLVIKPHRLPPFTLNLRSHHALAPPLEFRYPHNSSLLAA